MVLFSVPVFLLGWAMGGLREAYLARKDWDPFTVRHCRYCLGKNDDEIERPDDVDLPPAARAPRQKRQHLDFPQYRG